MYQSTQRKLKNIYENKVDETEVDLPVLKKFLFIFPLQPGIVFSGVFQLIATIVISCVAIVSFAEKSQHAGGAFYLVQMILVFMFTMVVSLLEVIFSGFLIYGAYKSNLNYLRVCLDYLKVKVPVYALLLLTSLLISLFVASQYWYYSNLDPWRYQLFMDNLALGTLDLVFQLYLLILVRSLIIKLDPNGDFSYFYPSKSEYTAGVPTLEDPVVTKPTHEEYVSQNMVPVPVHLPHA